MIKMSAYYWLLSRPMRFEGSPLLIGRQIEYSFHEGGVYSEDIEEAEEEEEEMEAETSSVQGGLVVSQVSINSRVSIASSCHNQKQVGMLKTRMFQTRF